MLPVEATGIGGAFEGGNLGAPMSFEDAVKVASKNFMKVRNGESPGIIIDVASYRNQGIRPPELASIDRAAFVKMLDERLKEHQQAQVAAQKGGPAAGGQNVGQQGQPQPQPMGGGITWADPQGRVSLSYPATWFQNPQAIQNLRSVLPGYALSVVDPASHCGLDVIFFEGVQDPNAVTQYMEGTMRNFGFGFEKGPGQQANFSGVTGTMIPIKIQTPNGVLTSVMSVLPVKGGMVLLNVGGPMENFKASPQILQSIVQSVRVAH
jgi:hypothetical protein